MKLGIVMANFATGCERFHAHQCLGATLEHLPLWLNYQSEKKMLKINGLERVLIGNVM